MARYHEEIPVASAARTSTGNSGILDTAGGHYREIIAFIDVTASSGGSSTLDVDIEDSLDGSEFNTLGSFAQKTGVATERITVTIPFANKLRILWTIGGTTPSFTFSVQWVLKD